MAVTEDRLDALSRAYGRQQTQLRTRSAAAARQLFVASAADGVPDPVVWGARYLRLVNAAQTATATAADVFVRQQVAVLTGEMVASTAVAVVEDLLIAPDTPWIGSPISRMRAVLADGQETVETAADAARLTATARDAAGRYAGQLMHNEVRATERQAAVRSANLHWETGEPLRWKRIPEPGACGWCRVVADRLYSADFAGDWHTDCHCDWRMVTAAESNGWKPEYRGDSWRDVIKERADPDPVRTR